MQVVWLQRSVHSSINGGIAKEDLSAENLDALKKGIVNLEKHIENLQQFGVPVVVT